MSRSCEVHAAGPDAIVVRRGTGSDAVHLRATGERLVAAAHPGVAEVISSTGTDDEWELQLVHAGRPIDLVGPLSVEQVAGAAAGVAAILADLHAAGVVHGSIDGSHVLIGSHGRPVLCGFAASTSFAARPEDDVAALGALIVTLLGSDAELEPIPDRRWSRHGSWTGWARRSLLLVADQACADPPTRRPNAHRLAAAIADAVPGAVAVDPPMVPDPHAGADHGDQVEPADPLDVLRAGADEAPRQGRLPALVCALLGVLVLGAGALRLAQPVASPGPVASAASSSSTTNDLGPQMSAPTTPVPVPPAPTTTPVTIDGTTVVVGTRHYEVGQPGDLVVVGDWDGDEVPTAAVLRPETGEVFVFSSWAGDAEVVVRPVATVGGAVELLVTDAGDRDQLLVRRADGSRHPILMAGTA